MMATLGFGYCMHHAAPRLHCEECASARNEKKKSMETPEIYPCLYRTSGCGNERIAGDGGRTWIECDCGARSPAASSPELALEDWNFRSLESRAMAPLEKVAEGMSSMEEALKLLGKIEIKLERLQPSSQSTKCRECGFAKSDYRPIGPNDGSGLIGPCGTCKIVYLRRV